MYQAQALRRRPGSVAHTESLTAGSRIPVLTVEGPAHSIIAIDWASERRPVLVYVLRPDCGWCARNLQNIKALRTAKQEEYRFVGLSLSSDGIEAYVRDSNLGFPVYTNPRFPHGGKFVVNATPLTAIIPSDGIVTAVWRGAYKGSVQDDIEHRMGIRLPGLSMAAAAHGTL